MRRHALLIVLLASLTATASAFAASAPVVVTGVASSLSGSAATVSGTVMNIGGQASTYSFQYGTTTAYGQSTAPASAGSGPGPVPVSASLTNLTPGTTYHFRLTATNPTGTSTGADATFVTPVILPTVVTQSAASTNAHGAVLAGTVATGGGATVYYFELGTSTAYKLRTEPITVAASAAPVPVSSAVGALQSDTTFHYRLVAVNSAGTTTGADQTFKTIPQNRVAPLGLTARTTPTTATAYPYRFFTTGTIIPPAGVNRGRACSGFVSIRFKVANRTISLRRATIGPDCHFSSRVTFHIPRRVRRGVLHVSELFAGNGVLGRRSGPTQTVFVG